MWVDGKLANPGDRINPPEYTGGTWVCERCESPDLDEYDDVCGECLHGDHMKKRAYIADTLASFGNDDFVELFNDALRLQTDRDCDTLLGLVELRSLLISYYRKDVAKPDDLSDAEKIVFAELCLQAMDRLTAIIEE